MTGIYVPIDSSLLKGLIPPGEEIIYSSLADVIESGGSAVYGSYTASWISHILLTPKSFAYTRARRSKSPEIYCVPLYTVRSFYYNVRSLQGGIEYKRRPFIRFDLRWEKNFETIETFTKRNTEFAYKYSPYLLEAKRERLNEMQANPGEFKKSQIKKMYKNFVETEKIMIRIARDYDKIVEKYPAFYGKKE
ncbi:MAG: hypothetical protein ACFFAK_16095 [Promethearchaeota archaeon]